MRIAFVCNQNLARSQTLQATFTKLAPSIEFMSFGLIAQEGTAIPPVIRNIFKNWNLPEPFGHARNLFAHWKECSTADIIFAATTLIAREVMNLEYQGVVINLEETANFAGLNLNDPQLMPQSRCSYELTKYLKCTILELQRRGLMPIFPTMKALIPRNESSISKTISEGLRELANGATIIYADFIAPRNILFGDALLEATKFTITSSDLDVDLQQSFSNALLVPSHASDFPAQTYLSKHWLGFLKHLATEKVILIAPPIESSVGKIAESHLAAMFAGNFSVICQD